MLTIFYSGAFELCYIPYDECKNKSLSCFLPVSCMHSCRTFDFCNLNNGGRRVMLHCSYIIKSQERLCS